MSGRITRIIAGVVTSLLAFTVAAQACPVCFGVEDSQLVDGTKAGVWFMLAVIVAIQAAFIGFFVYLRRRAKLVARVELDAEWSELQKAVR